MATGNKMIHSCVQSIEEPRVRVSHFSILKKRKSFFCNHIFTFFSMAWKIFDTIFSNYFSNTGTSLNYSRMLRNKSAF